MAETTGWAKCCSEVPEFLSDYKPVGTEINLGSDLKAYVVGPEDSKKAIIFWYDRPAYHLLIVALS